MKLKDIYKLAITAGIEADPRGKKLIKEQLAKKAVAFKKLDEDEKDFFDEEKLENPFADTRVLAGDPEMEIRGLIAGIDMEGPEILLADRLREKGAAIDLVMAHHPEGKALAALHDVMSLQADLWHQYGVPLNVGDSLMDRRAKEVQRALSPVNHNRAVDAAQSLEMALMCVHTPADNLVSIFLQNHFAKEDPNTVDDVVKTLKTIPEYSQASRLNAGPRIVVGAGNKRAGRIMVMMTGGTGGPEESIEKLASAGVGTLVEMHIDEKLKKKAEEHHVNVIVAGHIASDSVGMNLLLDQLENKGVEIRTCSGLIRIKRS